MSTSAEIRPSRERKAVEKYEVEVTEKKDLAIGSGEGTLLSEIPVILYYINNLQGDHDLLKAVHKIMYGGTGTSSMRKRQLRAFNGFPAATDASKIAATMTNSKSWKLKPCKDLCQFLDVDDTGDQAALIKSAVDFLMKPHATGNSEVNDEGIPLHRLGKVKKVKKRVRAQNVSDSDDDSEDDEPKAKRPKKTTKKKKAAKKKEKKKKAAVSKPTSKVGTPNKSGKPKSAKFLYIQDRKDAAKSEFPELQGAQLAMKLITEFKELDQETKDNYEKRAAEEKAAWEEA